MSRGGQAVPLGTIPESYDEAMKSLPETRRHADDLLVYDNTPNGKGHRLVARFIAGELVKTTHSAPQRVRDVFGRELRSEVKRQEKPSRER
jgi:predicted ABC-type ATPase